ncbi:hypothetical protein ACT1U9_13360 [Streptomyces sp. BR1]|uniref:hypothetical protein n=1 Tax=Streptomyces sp. BR1 TaxID=1592323 RepID=UPI00402BD1ED
MRSLVRVAGVAVCTAALSAVGVVGPVTSYAADGDERVAQLRARMVDTVNQETRHEIERLRECGDEASLAEADRLERLLRDSCRLSEQLHSVRAPVAGGAGVRGASAAPYSYDEEEPVSTTAVVLGVSVLLVGGGATVAAVRWRRREE